MIQQQTTKECIKVSPNKAVLRLSIYEEHSENYYIFEQWEINLLINDLERVRFLCSGLSFSG